MEQSRLHLTQSQREIVQQYHLIRLGYYLVGDAGVMSSWRFRGSWKLRTAVARVVSLFIRAAVPGWYDTHARHMSVSE